MKLAIFSHCVIDTIILEGTSYEQIGGPSCYGGLTAKNLKFDVELFTKFGSDFPHTEYLTEHGFSFKKALSEKPTTRFQIKITNSERDMILENICEPIEYEKTNADGFLISPIFNEISNDLFEKIKKDSNFTFVDPQGFLRRVDSNKNVFLEKTNIDLSNVSAIKVGVDEATNIAGNFDVDSLKLLQKMGSKCVLLTNKREISMLVDDKLYSLTLPNKEVYDTTGIGDIFCSTFCCTMLKEKDYLWAFCFAGGSAQAALDSHKIGLEKIPKRGATQSNASYFYNTIKFMQV